MRVNISGTLNVLLAARDQECKEGCFRFLFLSVWRYPGASQGGDNGGKSPLPVMGSQKLPENTIAEFFRNYMDCKQLLSGTLMYSAQDRIPDQIMQQSSKVHYQYTEERLTSNIWRWFSDQRLYLCKGRGTSEMSRQ